MNIRYYIKKIIWKLQQFLFKVFAVFFGTNKAICYVPCSEAIAFLFQFSDIAFTES